jgi:hypothetical protein
VLPVEVALLDGEEVGALGSAHHAPYTDKPVRSPRAHRWPGSRRSWVTGQTRGAYTDCRDPLPDRAPGLWPASMRQRVVPLPTAASARGRRR